MFKSFRLWRLEKRNGGWQSGAVWEFIYWNQSSPWNAAWTLRSLCQPVHFLYPPLCALRSVREPMLFCTAKNLTLLLPKVVWCNLHSRILTKWLGWNCRSDSVIEWNSEQCPAKTLVEERYVFHRHRMTGMSLTLGHLNLCWSDGGFESVDISQSPCGGIKGVGLPLTV